MRCLTRHGSDRPSLSLSLIGFGHSALALVLGCLAPSQGLAQENLGNLTNFNYWQNLCTLQIQNAQYAEARAACEKAIELRPQEADLWTAHSGLLLELDQYSEAIAATEQALTLNPENFLALLNQCEAYFELGQLDQAQASCNQALEMDQSWGNQNAATARLYQGRILAAQQDYEAALVAYERALLENRGDAEVLTYRCATYLNWGRFNQAVDSCKAALAGDGEWGSARPALAWYYQGLAHRGQEDFESAIAAFDASLRLDANAASAWMEQGNTLALLNRYREALVAYERAAALEPTLAARLGQCAMLNKTGQYSAALTACEAALTAKDSELGIEQAKVLSQQAQAFAGLGQYPQALAAIDRALGLAPDYAEAWNNRGAVLTYLERWQEAVTALQQAAELDPGYASPWANLGRVQRMLGQYTAAIAAYDEALERSPEDAELWANRSAVQWHLAQHEAALTSADRAISLNERSYLGWYNRATALVSLERYREAGRAYQQAIRLEPDSADAWTGMGIALLRLQRYDEARGVLARALMLNPQQIAAQRAWQSLPTASPANR